MLRHSDLLFKLCDVGISGNVFNFVAGIFGDDTKDVIVDSVKREDYTVVSGLLQGNVQGPLF